MHGRLTTREPRAAAAEVFFSSDEGRAWAPARDAVRATGYAHADLLVHELATSSADTAPADVIAACREFTAQRRLFDCLRKPHAAIAARLRNGVWPVDGVRSLAELEASAERRRERQAAAAEQRRADEKARAEAAEERERLRQLEREHGPWLDRLTREEFISFANQVAWNDPQLERLVQTMPTCLFVRRALLVALGSGHSVFRKEQFP